MKLKKKGKEKQGGETSRWRGKKDVRRKKMRSEGTMDINRQTRQEEQQEEERRGKKEKRKKK